MKMFGRKLIFSVLACSIIVFSCGISTTSFAATSSGTKVFPKYYDSSYLTVESDAVIKTKVDALIKTMTAGEKFALLGGDPSGTGKIANAGWLPGVPRLGVPEIRMYDGPAGTTSIYETTNPSIEEMLASSWSKALAYNYGKIEGSENKAMSGNVQLGSQFDIMRIPQFSRSKILS